MSTNDVPGAVAAHNDELAMGCWAEHDDGSLIFVQSTENDRVVYSIFDMSRDPIIEYRDAMMLSDFETQFSWDCDDTDSEKWTWHDKTPFPWERVIKDFPSGAQFSSAGAIMTAAKRIGERLGLRPKPAPKEKYAHMTDVRVALEGAVKKLQDAIQSLRP